MSRMRRTYIVPLGLLLLFGTSGFAQERRWTLEECIAHAYEHNIEIKTEELTAAEKRIALSESKWNYAPDLSASTGVSFSTGRVLDETTYEFVENETVAGNNASLGANIQIFGGLKNYYNLKRAQLDLRSSLLAVEKMRNDVRMNVTAYYLEILCAEETIRDAEQVVAELRIQEEKTAKKVEARKVTTADLLQIRSQLADAENDVLTARNTYDIARLNLCQLLEIDDYTTFRTVAPDVGELTRYDIADSPAEVLDAARGLPELEAARVGIDLARRNLQIARTAYWPTLSLWVELFGRPAEDVPESRRHLSLRRLSVFRTIQGQCEQLCVAVAQYSDFRQIHDPQERAAAETRHTAGRIRPAYHRETGGEGGYAGAHRCPHGMGAIPRSAEIRRLGRGGGPADRPQVRPRCRDRNGL